MNVGICVCVCVSAPRGINNKSRESFKNFYHQKFTLCDMYHNVCG